MIELYTWPTPNGRKISIALEEFGLEYRVHAVDIGAGAQHTPEFLRLSPNGKIPAILDTSNDRHLMESGAILLYLMETYGRFTGDDRWETVQWLMLQMASVGPMLGQTHHFHRFNPGKAPYAETRFLEETRRLYGVLDRRLEGREYLSGSYSIADMATWPWISRYEWHDIDWADYPHLRDWYARIARRPAVQAGYDVPHFVNPIPLP